MCTICWVRLRDDLQSVAELAEDLDIALTRDVRFSAGGIGIVVRSADNPLPPNLRIGEVQRELRRLLGSWVRDLWETHAVRFQQCSGCGARWYGGDMLHVRESCAGEWSEVIDSLSVVDTLPELAAWLLRHPTWIKGHRAALELWDEIVSGVNKAWLAVDRPAGREYLGVCWAEIGEGDECAPCGLDLYAKAGRRIAKCRCGTEYDVEAHRSELVELAGDELLTATGVSRALPRLLGRTITAAQIRGLAYRGRLVQYEASPDDPRGDARYRVSEVADLLAEMAAEEPVKAAS